MATTVAPAPRDGRSELRRRVLADPADRDAWLGLSRAFDAADQPGRAAACLSAISLSDPEHPALAERGARIAQAQQRVFQQRRAAEPDLSAADETQVSVIIPTYNRPEWLGRAIESALAQTLSDVEVVVVNDGGDPSAESVAAQFPSHQVRYLYTENGGLSAARNHGLLRARGRYIAYVDDDDILYPDHLSVLVDHLERNKQVFAYSRALRLEKQRSGDGWELKNAEVPFARQVDRRTVSKGNFTPVLGVVHRRDALRKTGLFDPEIFSVQDWHLWQRFARRHEFEHIPVITGEYDLRMDSSSMQGGASDDHFFHALMLNMENLARAEHWQRRTHRMLDTGDVQLATSCLTRAWECGLAPEQFVQTMGRVARYSTGLAGRLAALGGGEIAPLLRGPYRLVAQGAHARQRLSRRVRRQWLRQVYRDAAERGLEQARLQGFQGDA